jgi:hypothetical protein
MAAFDIGAAIRERLLNHSLYVTQVQYSIIKEKQRFNNGW